ETAECGGAMASADLRYELTCSICLNIYRDPVTLPCGHSFCRLCIAGVLNAQEGSGAYMCPECRAESQERPALEKNRKLGNIAESFRSSHPEQEEVGIPCTYCDSPVPAAKTCLHCEASLCEKHLKKHSKSAEHVLTEPTTSLENCKCSVHREILKYYCCEDAAWICMSCRLDGEHRGHQVETLNEASEKKKEKLRNILQKLTSQREEAEKSVQNLEELRRQVQEKAAGVTGHVTLEKRVLSEISRQEEQVSLRVSDLIRQQEIKKEELSRKTSDIEELCDMMDPVTSRTETPERFQDYAQVLSSRSFSSGRHYWEVERNGSGRWKVGMTYPSIARKGDHSRIGKNNKSWALEISGIMHFHQSVSVIHDSKETRIRHISGQRLGILLNYEAGRLSFYELCDPIRHIHTFTAAFTEPLHAVNPISPPGDFLGKSPGS
uniref:Uncharacterized protein n=1 Tax=Leptobrachium leishanense TaxID=445787 RepID=A0A8C5WCU7_9ANUR